MKESTLKKEIIWGSIFLESLEGVMLYEANDCNGTLQVQNLQLLVVLVLTTCNNFFGNANVWNIVSSLVLWTIWKTRCWKRYVGRNANVVDIVEGFWEDLDHFIEGEYDNFIGSAKKVHKKCNKLQKVWFRTLVMQQGSYGVRWNFLSPQWLFPPPMPSLIWFFFIYPYVLLLVSCYIGLSLFP